MPPPNKKWIKGIVTTLGAVTAGPTGALIGALVGSLFQVSLPGLGAYLGSVTTNLASDGLVKASRKIIAGIDPPVAQCINHDLQTAFRDAFREALYDLGGTACFPLAWQNRVRDVPAALVFPQTPSGHTLWQRKSPLAAQVEDLFQEMARALDEQAILPLEPPVEKPAGSAQVYLHALSSADLAKAGEEEEKPLPARAYSDAFFDQVVAPYLERHRVLLGEVPQLCDHLRFHLLDRVLVHFGELIKTREKAWRAFNRTMLEAVYQQTLELGQGQEELLQRLAALSSPEASEKVAENMAVMIAAFGGMEKQIDSRFDQVAAQAAENQQALLYRFDRLGAATRRIEQKVDRVLRILENGQMLVEGEPPVAMDEPPAAGVSPFQGLLYFDVTDSERFFGRDTLVARLVGLLRANSFLAIVGASGSGKSSVARAGLIPALKAGRPLADGTLPPPGSEHWPVFVITPTAHPLDALAAALTQERKSLRATAALKKDLADADGLLQGQALQLYARKLLADKRRRGEKVLLVVDQFEELFTACRDPGERQGFLNNLMAAANDGLDSPIRLVIALRADFYAQCGQYEELRTALEVHQAFIGPMSGAELRQAIEEPAAQAGWEIEPGLVELILNDVGSEPGALPLLSHALLETWQHRRGRMMTLESYAESGGVRGAVAQTAELVYQQLSSGEREIARRTFLRLTEPGEGVPATRRRAQFSELFPETDAGTRVRSVLKTLADARLLTLGENTAEVAHEALIREWGTLQAWLDEDRESLRVQRHITEAAAEWDRLGREPGELYRGVRLAQADEWAGEHRDELTALESAFLQTSRQAQEAEEAAREQQRQRELDQARQLAEAQAQRAQAEQARAEAQAHNAARLRRRAVYLSGALAAALLAIAAAVIFWNRASQTAVENASLANLNATAAVENANVAQTAEAASTQAVAERDQAAQARTEAEAARKLSEQKALLAQAGEIVSKMQLVSNPYLKTLLAVEAITRARQAGEEHYPAAEEMLADFVVRSGGTVIDHSDTANILEVSADGMWMASDRWDNNKIDLWDLRQPGAYTRHITLVSGLGGEINDLAFSPDGRWLASAHDNGSISVWEMAAITSDPPAQTIRCQSIQAHEHEVRDIAFSQDSMWLVSGGQDGKAGIWDLTGISNASPQGSISSILTLEDDWPYPYHATNYSDDNLTNNINSIWLAPDRSRLVTGGYNSIFLWDLSGAIQPGERITSTGPRARLLSDGASVQVSPDGRWLLVTGYNKPLTLWDLNGSAGEDGLPPRAEIAGVEEEISRFAFSTDSQKLVIGDKTGKIQLFSLGQGMPGIPYLQLDGQADELLWLKFSPDGRKLFAGVGWQIRIWDLSLPKPGDASTLINPYEHGSSPVFGSGVFFTRSYAGISAWDLEKPLDRGAPVALGAAHAIVVEKDRPRFYTATEDGLVAAWKIREGRLVLDRIIYNNPENYFNLLALSPDERWLVAGYQYEQGVVLFDLSMAESQGEIPAYALPTGGPSNGPLSFDPLGRWLVTYGTEGSVELRALSGDSPGAVIERLGGLDSPVSAYAFDAAGKNLYIAGSGKTAELWDVSAGINSASLAQQFEFGGSTIVMAAASPDGRWVATGDTDGTVNLTDLSRLPEYTIYHLSINDSIQFLYFSPDSRWLVVDAWTDTPIVWDLQAKNISYANTSLLGHENEIYALAFSPDSRWLATGGTREAVRLWDLLRPDLGSRNTALSMPGTQVLSLAFSPDGQWVVAGGIGDSLLAWPVDTYFVVEMACKYVGRNLGMDEWSQYIGVELYRATCPQHEVPYDVTRYYEEEAWDQVSSENYPLAIEMFQYALALSPEDDNLKTSLAWGYFYMEDYPTAIDSFLKLHESLPENQSVIDGLAQTYKARGEKETAAAYYIKNGWVYFFAGEESGEEEDRDHASAQFNTAIELDPRNSEAYAGLGWVELQAGEPGKAREYFDQALQVNSQDLIALRGIAWLYWEQEEYDLALDYYDQVLAIDPTNQKALYNRAYVNMDLKEYASAAADFERLVEIDPAYLTASNYRTLARAYIALEKLDLARQALEESISRSETPLQGCIDAGWEYYNAARYDLAGEMFARALEIEPGSIDALNGLGWSSFDQEEFDRAFDSFSRAIAIDPGHADSLRGRGWAGYRLGNYAQVILDLEKFFAFSPDWSNEPEYSILGTAYWFAGDPGKAEETFLKIIGLHQDLARGYSSIGWNYLNLGDYNASQRYFERSLAEDNNYAQSHLGLGSTAYGQERWEEALRWYETYLSLETRPADWVLERVEELRTRLGR